MRSDAPPLMPLFRSRHQAELLTWLFLHPDEGYSVTDLAHRLDVPVTTLHREASRLVEAELVTSRPAGRTRLLSANPAHPGASPLTQLLEISFGPKPVIAEEFDLDAVEDVVIYGSWAARYAGESGPPPNDIDVLVIGTPTRAAVYEAADRAQARLGLAVNPVIRTPGQWADPHDPLSAQVRASSSVSVRDDVRDEQEM